MHEDCYLLFAPLVGRLYISVIKHANFVFERLSLLFIMDALVNSLAEKETLHIAQW